MDVLENVVRKVPRQKRSQEKFNAILEACPRVIERQGYDNTSPIDIAKEAGVATGTLYEYFPNKESICLTHMSHTMDKIVRDIEGLVTRNPKNLSKRHLKMVMLHMIDKVRESREQNKKIIEFLPSSTHILLMEDTQNKILKVAKIVSWFYLGKESKPDLELLTFILYNAIIGIVIKIIISDIGMESNRVASGIVDLICGYAATMDIHIKE